MADPASLDLLLQLHPRGAWNLDDGSLARAELAVWGDALDAMHDQLVLLVDEVLPDTALATLSAWERVYDLHPPAGRTPEQRRRTIISRRRHLPDLRPETMDSVITAEVGTGVTIIEPGPLRCDDVTTVIDDPIRGLVDGQFVFLVSVDHEDLFRASGVARSEIGTTLERIKPAHTFARLYCDDFITNDDLSRCDWDSLGA